MKNKVWVITSLIFPIIINVLSVQSTFWFSSVKSINNFESVYIFTSIAIGVFIFSKVNFPSNSWRIWAWVIYLAALFQIIFWGNLLTACANGDCL
ncbi:hypothetical protein [Pseudoalteromonas umbrosa]|uniref:hypothetical protein n=1 Tax=Pseudoalteromonas umbrosa TaxID=3048489 RepID=UPI0024C3F5AE|nr:hypothetical protein [Pseudoalteromonas sp. B95]MDK1286796.1 hypothetical protein [Pseudoalteromonas sp. B95]